MVGGKVSIVLLAVRRPLRAAGRDEDGWAASSRQSRTVTEGLEVSETPPIAELAALPFAE